MGRRKVNYIKSTHVSETEEREKVKESILKAFRARLNLPNKGGALVIGHSKHELKDQENKHGARKPPNGYNTDTSSDSMSGRDTARKKRSTVKRRKRSSKIDREAASSAVTKHMKVARGVTYSVCNGKDGVTDKGISSMITHSRITQQIPAVGIVNTGKKSASVTRAPLQVPEHIRKQTKEELKKILDSTDDSVKPIADLNEVQSVILSQGSKQTRPVTPASVEMNPQSNICSTRGSIVGTSPYDPLDRFTEVLPLKETVVSLMSSLKAVNKQIYPGRDYLNETTDELLKLMKQNAPRSATPTPIPLFNKVTSSGSVQRRLVDQFPPEISSDRDTVTSDLTDAQKVKGINLQHYNSIQSSDIKLPSTIKITDTKPFQPLHVQNTAREKADRTNLQINSLQNYKNSRTGTDNNLKLLANVLDKLHEGSEKENVETRMSHSFKSGRNIYNIELGNLWKKEVQKGKENLEARTNTYKNINDDLNLCDTNPGIYVLKKQRISNNLQMLYESAKLLQKQYIDPRKDGRDELFKDGIEKIFASGNAKEKSEEIGSFLGCSYKEQNVKKLDSVLVDLERKSAKDGDDIVTYLEASAKKGLSDGYGVFEPMEVDDKDSDLEQEAVSLLQKNDRKLMEAEAVEMLRKPLSIEGISGRTVSSFIDYGADSHSQDSSQCSHCSCAKSSRYSGSQHGDILSQVVTKETDYMPSFHGGFYVDQLNAKDLMQEENNEKEMHVENDAMDILDYIDNRRSDSLALKHRILQKVSSPVLERQRILRVGDHLMRYKSVKPLEIESPDEPKLYPRHMY